MKTSLSFAVRIQKAESNSMKTKTLYSLHRQILSAIPDGITVQDLSFNIIFQNNAMKNAFGDRIGQKCYLSYERRDRICEGCGLAKSYKTGEPVLVHRTGVLENGSIEHWENSCFPLYDDKGNIVAGVEVCRNVTDRVSLAQEVRERTIELGHLNDSLNHQKLELEKKTEELKGAYKELKRAHTKMLQQEKMASIGQLAAGIAHEINTPIQFVGDNISFLNDSFDDLIRCLTKSHNIIEQTNENNDELIRLHSKIDTVFEEIDLDYLTNEVPLAIEQTTDGVKRVTEIVQAMRNFAHMGATALGPVDMDDVIRSTVAVSRNTWKQVAEMKLELSLNP